MKASNSKRPNAYNRLMRHKCCDSVFQPAFGDALMHLHKLVGITSPAVGERMLGRHNVCPPEL